MNQQLPAILQSIQQPAIIDLFGSASQEQERQQAILHHAMAVIQHFQNMNVSAVQICVHLYLCREEFKASGQSGWEKFCAANFESYGLNSGKIRNSVRAGRSIVNTSKKLKDEGGDADMSGLNTLSRTALFILCDAPPEVQERLIIEMNAVEDQSSKGPTADEIRRRVEQLEAESEESKKLIESKDLALQRIGNALDAREKEVAQSRQEIAALNRKLSTPVDHVVHRLPPGIESEQIMRDRLSEDISFRKSELERTEAEINRLKLDKAKYENEMAAKRQVKDVLESLDTDIKLMMVKYTDALMQKLSNTDPERVAPLLEAAAMRLRVLANQLSPSLI